MKDLFNRRVIPDGWSQSCEGLLLPDPILDARTEELAEQETREAEKSELEAQQTSAATLADRGQPVEVSSSPQCIAVGEAASVPTLQVVDPASIAAIEKRAKNRYGDSADRDRAKDVLASLRLNNGVRVLAQLGDDAGSALDELEEDFPNFRAPIDLLRCALSIAKLRDRVPVLPPLLFNGPPGIGKTYVIDRIAQLFGLDLVRVSLEKEQSNSTLSGSSEYWSNTRAGMVFNALVSGRVANPVILVDEVDKAGGDSRYDPMGSLYSLLDRRQAAVFADLSFPDIRLNASRVTWVLTSNQADILPDPIKSRVRRFDVPAPTSAQCKVLARKIFDVVRRELLEGIAFAPLTEDICALVAQVSPRVMEQTLAEAAGRALYAGRRYIVAADIYLPPSTPRIGFVD